MLGADILTVAVDAATGTVTAQDRYVPWASYPLLTAPMPSPVLDNCNDWEVLSGDQVGPGWRFFFPFSFLTMFKKIDKRHHDRCGAPQAFVNDLAPLVCVS